MEKLHDLKEKLCEELEDYARKQDMGAGDLEVIHKLTDTIKNIDKICMLEGEDGYSQSSGYDGGSSYANRGRHYVRGHYSRDGGNMGGYSVRREANISTATIYSWFKNEKSPSLKNIQKICIALNITLCDFFS